MQRCVATTVSQTRQICRHETCPFPPPCRPKSRTGGTILAPDSSTREMLHSDWSGFGGGCPLAEEVSTLVLTWGRDPGTDSNLDDTPKHRRRRRGESHGFVEASHGGSGEKTCLKIPWSEKVVACLLYEGKAMGNHRRKAKVNDTSQELQLQSCVQENRQLRLTCKDGIPSAKGRRNSRLLLQL